MACPEASVGWGVPLTSAPVGWSPHPSIRDLAEAGSALFEPEPQGSPERYHLLLAVETTGYQNYGRSALAVYVKRTLACTADSTGDVDPAALTPPTPGELACMARYLDEAGFTGDRTVRLLLVAREA